MKYIVRLYRCHRFFKVDIIQQMATMRLKVTVITDCHLIDLKWHSADGDSVSNYLAIGGLSFDRSKIIFSRWRRALQIYEKGLTGCWHDTWHDSCFLFVFVKEVDISVCEGPGLCTWAEWRSSGCLVHVWNRSSQRCSSGLWTSGCYNIYIRTDFFRNINLPIDAATLPKQLSWRWPRMLWLLPTRVD